VTIRDIALATSPTLKIGGKLFAFFKLILKVAIPISVIIFN
jgi:hypothetical protein